ncbi:MAG: dodecin family protein [Dietzia sp.]|uniref:dodecin n=1 Tax=Dietzia TaxID=37914 RepID=UPI0015FB34FF|nr:MULTISPECIES: dodecin [Dietzia]MBB1052427.1 dodecin family protein [Dietzia sp. CW19]MCT1514365.1 dodecin family protein [Dietzia cercidiphylli]MDO8394797.1 dodecin family protein [Dietzia sp.]
MNHVYSVTEIVGSSPDGTDAAIANAIAEASKSLRNLEWFEVQSVRGKLDGDRVAHWQVTIKVGFRHES